MKKYYLVRMEFNHDHIKKPFEITQLVLASSKSLAKKAVEHSTEAEHGGSVTILNVFVMNTIIGD